MTHSLIDDAALGLLTTINNKVAREILQVTYKISIASVLKKRVEYHISYFLPKHDAFCVLNVAVTQYDSNKLFFEVHAELNKFGFQEADLDKFNIEDFMLELYPLRPVVTNGFTHYHLNQDGQTEFSDEPFHRTISDMTGGFIRMYAKRFPDKSLRMRLERIITPECTVRTQVSDMKNLGDYLYSDEENLSKLMPSHILAYNRLGTIIQKQASIYNPTHNGVTFI